MNARWTAEKAWTAAKGAASRAGLAVKTALGSMRFPGYGGQSSGPGGSGRANWFRQLLPGSAGYDYQAEAGPLWMNSAVAVCAGWVRKNFPEARLTVEVRDGTEWVENPQHPILDALEEPNRGYDDDVLWAATALSLIVDGNGYWLKARARRGAKLEYWYAPHWQVTPCWPADGSEFISHYEYRVDGRVYEVPVEDVIHFRVGLDLLNERLGWSELKTCLREVCSDNEANTYVAAILKNMGVVGVVISPENPTDEILEDDARDLIGNWKLKTTGTNRGEPLVNRVALKITQLGLSPEQLTLDKIRQVPEARICAAIGVPAMVVGLSVGKDGRTFSNLAEANRHAYQNCLIPLQKSMAKAIQRQSRDLIGPRRVERLVWRYDEVDALREDQSEVTKRLVVACGGPIMTPNEGRSRIGLRPDPSPESDKIRAQAAAGTAPSIGGNRTESEAK